MTKVNLIDKIDSSSMALNGVYLAVLQMCECASPDPNQSDEFNAWGKLVLDGLKCVMRVLGEVESGLKEAN